MHEDCATRKTRARSGCDVVVVEGELADLGRKHGQRSCPWRQQLWGPLFSLGGGLEEENVLLEYTRIKSRIETSFSKLRRVNSRGGGGKGGKVVVGRQREKRAKEDVVSGGGGCL